MGSKKRAYPSVEAILGLAGRQHGLVTRAQLVEAGLSRGAIEHRLRRGRLHRVHRSVFAVGRPELTREGRWLAAVLACGEGAALSHLSAAGLWGIWERAEPQWPHVSVAGRTGRRGPRGVELHASATLRPNDITERSAISVTTLPRTLLDLAPRLNAKRLNSALRQAERLHGLDLPTLSRSLDVLPPSSPPRANLKKALSTYVPGTAETEADAEAAFLELCAKHGIPLPIPQVPVGRYRADFMWPELNLVVEIDDRQSHNGFIAFQEDRVRDRAMKAAGLEVLRFTRHEVLRRPAAVARELAGATARLGASSR